MDIENKVAFVTGASKGIGEAVAKAFATKKARLFLVARSGDRLASLADTCASMGAPEVVTHTADLADPAAVDATVKAVHEAYDGYDILVNNAGVGQPKPITEVRDEELDHDLALNVRTPYVLTRDAVRTMRARGGGQVVQIASGLAYRGMADWSLYAGSKFALRGFTECVRHEVSEEGIKVGTVAPGYTDTRFFDGWGPPEAFREPITPDDVAYAVVAMVEQSGKSDIREITVRNPASP